MLCQHPTLNWLELLIMAEFALNSLVQYSMGKTPNVLVFGVPLWSIVDHLDGLHPVQGAQDKVRAIFDITYATHTKIKQA